MMVLVITQKTGINIIQCVMVGMTFIANNCTWVSIDHLAHS
jgi:hypothetical protein